jgi:hypothetical protein
MNDGDGIWRLVRVLAPPLPDGADTAVDMAHKLFAGA